MGDPATIHILHNVRNIRRTSNAVTCCDTHVYQRTLGRKEQATCLVCGMRIAVA